MRASVLFVLFVHAFGIRMKSPDEARCSVDPHGEWRENNGTEYIQRFWKNHAKYPDLCVSDKPCSPDKYSQKYVSEFLKPFDANKFLQSLGNKTVSFIGDSLQALLFEHIACAMAPVSDMISNIERTTTTNQKGITDGGFHRISFKNGAVLQFQYSSWGIRAVEYAFEGKTEEFEQKLFDADIIIFNIGAWFSETYGLDNFLLPHLLDTHNRLSPSLRPGGRLIFREYYPSHYSEPHKKWNPKGHADYHDVANLNPNGAPPPAFAEDSPAKAQCAPNRFAGQLKIERERRDAANQLMKSLGWEILKTFDIAATQWFMHPESELLANAKDCRHWCNQSPVLDSTKLVLANMLEEH